MAARTRYTMPLSPSLERKFAALGARFELTVLAAGRDGSSGRPDARFRLVSPFPVRALDGPLFYMLFPWRLARELRRRRPEAVLVQGAHETALALAGRALARSKVKVILDLHGDPRAPTRLYGSGARAVLAPLADRLAGLAVRRCDAVRTLSPFTSDIVRGYGVEPAAEFPAFMDLAPFTARPPEPLPERPTLLFVGVLQRYKAFDVIARAWRLAAPRVPDAGLHVVGRGPLVTLVDELVRDFPGRVRHTEELPTEGVAAAMDAATGLVLASRSEGLPRIVVESFCRGRAVIGARAGGIPDILQEGVNGLLVPGEDAAALAEAMVALLADRGRAEQLGEGAHATSSRWLATPEDFAERTAELVERVIVGGR